MPFPIQSPCCLARHVELPRPHKGGTRGVLKPIAGGRTLECAESTFVYGFLADMLCVCIRRSVSCIVGYNITFV